MTESKGLVQSMEAGPAENHNCDFGGGFVLLFVCFEYLCSSFPFFVLVSKKFKVFPSSKPFVFFFCLFRAAPAAYGGPQSRGHIRPVAASLRHSHRNAGSKLSLQPTPQLPATPDP